MTIALNYPHDTRSHEPLQLSKRDIWRLAEDARSQAGGSKKPKLNFTDLAVKARRLRINGLELETRWEFVPGVHDERGHSVLGAIEYDPAVQRTALVYLNSAELAEREDITRSTAAHELAHAIFDAPGWARQCDRLAAETLEPSIRFRSVVRRYRSPSSVGISEWRANEFMGAFLAPPNLLRREMLKVFSRLSLPRGYNADGLPVIDTRRLGPYQVQAVADELAEGFGLSIAFIEYRLHRYGFAPETDK